MSMSKAKSQRPLQREPKDLDYLRNAPRSGISEIVSSRLPRSLLARVVLKFVPGYNFQVTVIRKGGLFSRSPFCAGSKDDLYIILLKFLWNLTTDDDLSYILPQDLYPCPSGWKWGNASFVSKNNQKERRECSLRAL
jgi:hypothetical protein